jgi:type IV pilus assembly protein PilV
MIRHSSNRNAAGAQRGFSLVEVLIALIIMSVGMLGIAGLYVQSMQAGRTSLFRHNAVTLAGDVADRIRANPRAGVDYMGPGVDNSCVGMGIDCTPTQMAANDILLWDQQARDSLPNGAVTMQFDGGVTPPVYTITISWTEAGQDPPPSYTITIPVFGF